MEKMICSCDVIRYMERYACDSDYIRITFHYFPIRFDNLFTITLTLHGYCIFVDDPFKTNIGASNYTVLVPHVLQLLRFCFLTRRDVPAITLLNLLAEEPKKFIDLIWRVFVSML